MRATTEIVTPDAESQIEVPSFPSAAAERAHRLRRLAGALRLFGEMGFATGVAGHLTVRDPEHLDRLWVNPFGRAFTRLRPEDLLQVDLSGQVHAGEGRLNRAAVAIHGQIYRARPDVHAAVHAHSPGGEAWAALDRPLDPLTQDACAFYEDHAVLDEFSGAVEDAAYGRRLAERLGSTKALIHANHGLVTVGASIDEAAWWFILMERCCLVQLRAEAAGAPRSIPPGPARQTRETIGTPTVGWFQFQPLWEDLVARHPDLAGPEG